MSKTHEDYVDVMLQSLKKKLQVLESIEMANVQQKEQLENPELTVDEFDALVEKKSALIDQLTQLDSGFDKLFARVREELNNNTQDYAEQIKSMKGYIKLITDKSMEIQAQEARNKDLMVAKFTHIKEVSRNVRAKESKINSYYKNMNQLNYVDPQFLDGKN